MSHAVYEEEYLGNFPKTETFTAVQTMVSHAEDIGISIALQILCYQQSTWPLWGMVVFSQLKVNGPDEEHCAFCGSSIHVPIVA